MIKQLKKHDVQTTPFIATKDWHLLNVQHPDLVLLEPYSSSVLIPDTFVSLEFIDYSFGNPFGVLNTACNVALEQQEFDPITYEEGISGSGLFFLNDPKNPSGTYKRLVYQQILRAFYNSYHNPLQIFGLEKFDFQTSGMQRYLSNYFKIFTLPQQKFGDKIQPGSVVFVDNSFDDNYTVTDDCQGNLLASPNLFSRTQEVRHIENILVDGTAVFFCEEAITEKPTPTGPFTMAAVLTASLTSSILGTCQVAPFTMSLDWTDPFTNEMGFYLYMSILDVEGGMWSPFNYIASVGQNVTHYDFPYNLQFASASFRAVAFNPLGVSDPSTSASVFTSCSYFPPAPITLSVMSGSAILNWATESWATQDSFNLWKKIDNGAYVDYASTLDPITTYVDTDVTWGHLYTYQVAAVNGLGRGQFSNEASISFSPPPTPPPFPPILDPIVSGSALVNWHSQSNDQDYFALERSTDGFNFFEITTTAAAIEDYEDFNVTSTLVGSQYWYRVAAVNSGGTSSYSNVEDITFFVYPPLTPTITSVISSSATINWIEGGTNQDYFPIAKSVNGVDFYEITTVPAGIYTYVDTDVSSSIGGNTYWYRAAAVNYWASSSWGNIVSITFTTPTPPAPPILDPIISGSALVYWHSQSNDQDFFSLERSINGVNYAEITTTIWSDEDFIDTNVQSSEDGNTYWYRVAAVNTLGTSSYSNVEAITFQYSNPNICKSSSFTPQEFTGSLTPWITSSREIPTASFTGDPLYGYALLHVAFTNYSSHSLTYLWDFGDGNTSTAVNPVHAYPSGTYTVGLTAYNGGLSDTEVKPDYVTVIIPGGGGPPFPDIAPTASFTAFPQVGEAPLTVDFYNWSQNANTFDWDFGDGGFSFEVEPQYIYNNPGQYTVVLNAYLGAKSDTMTRVAYINVVDPQRPAAMFSAAPQQVCTGDTVTFTNQSLNYTSSYWDFGDGNFSNEQNPTHQYSSNGAYNVTLTVYSASYNSSWTGDNSVVVAGTLCPCSYPTANRSIDEVTWTWYNGAETSGRGAFYGTNATIDLPVKGDYVNFGTNHFCVDDPCSITFSMDWSSHLDIGHTAFVDIYLDDALVSPSLNTGQDLVNPRDISGTYVLSRSLAAGAHQIGRNPYFGLNGGVYAQVLSNGFIGNSNFSTTLKITINPV